MEEIDKRVEELKKMNWEEMYEKDNERLELASPPFKDLVKFRAYRFKWCLKHIKQMTNRTDIRILNIGSSSGIFEYFLKEDGYENIFGLDVDDKTIERCRKNVPGITFKKGFAEKLPFNNNIFDVVIATEVVEHLKEPDKVLIEMKRVLKNNGIMLITVPIGSNLSHELHLHEFDLYKLCKLFKNIGEDFTIVEISKWNERKVHTSPNIFAVKYIKGDE